MAKYKFELLTSEFEDVKEERGLDNNDLFIPESLKSIVIEVDNNIYSAINKLRNMLDKNDILGDDDYSDNLNIKETSGKVTFTDACGLMLIYTVKKTR